MNTLQQKLVENRNRRRRDELLTSAPAGLASALMATEFCSDPKIIANAAFATWDTTTDTWTTTRGIVQTWRKHDCISWAELVAYLKSLSFSTNLVGWFFFEVDGPYFKISSVEFERLIDEIARYCEDLGKYDFGWVSSSEDCGVIVEFEHTSFCKNNYSVCIWGEASQFES